MKKIIVIALLSMVISACDSSSTDNSNSSAPNTNGPARVTPAPATPTPDMSPTAKVELKAGDKVKVNVDGASSEATIVSIDEKSGKATVRIDGQKDKLVAISDITKQ